MAQTGLTAGTLNQEVIHAAMGSGVLGSSGGAQLQLTRQARRIYVGNLPVQLGLTEKILLDFFTNTVVSLGVVTPNPVLSVWISSEMTFCFVEFRSIADASACLTLLQGIALGGRVLRVGRPADYKALPSEYDNYIVGFPPGTFQPPKAEGAGLAGSILNLNADSKISELSATIASSTNIDKEIEAAHSSAPTKVVHLLNMVKAEDLKDNEEYLDILEDVKEECSKHGHVGKVIIPRPGQPYPASLIGTILVLFDSEDSSKKARDALDGMTFSENHVKGRYYDEQKFVDILAVSMALDSMPETAETKGNSNPPDVLETTPQPAPTANGVASGATVAGNAINELDAQEEDLD